MSSATVRQRAAPTPLELGLGATARSVPRKRPREEADTKAGEKHVRGTSRGSVLAADASSAGRGLCSPASRERAVLFRARVDHVPVVVLKGSLGSARGTQ